MSFFFHFIYFRDIYPLRSRVERSVADNTNMLSVIDPYISLELPRFENYTKFETKGILLYCLYQLRIHGFHLLQPTHILTTNLKCPYLIFFFCSEDYHDYFCLVNLQFLFFLSQQRQIDW